MSQNLPLQREDAAIGLPLSLQIALALLLAAIFGIGWLWQRRRSHTGGPAAAWLAGWLAPPEPAQALQLQRPVRIAPGASLHVVRWGAEELLLACTPSGVCLVARRACAAPEAPESPITGANA